MRSLAVVVPLGLALVLGAFLVVTRCNTNPSHAIGDKLDEFNGVAVYHNGGVSHTGGRSLTANGYNLGLKYQCVEFAKRYYYERFGHQMPNSMGNAKDLFSASVPDGTVNPERGLLQYHNGSRIPPAPEDLLVFGPWVLNPYGHVAVVTQMGADFVEIIQQNSGPFGASRARIPLIRGEGGVQLGTTRVLGWLRRRRPQWLRS